MVNFSASTKVLIAALVATPLVLSGCSKDSEDSTETSAAASSVAASGTAAPSQAPSGEPAPASTAPATQAPDQITPVPQTAPPAGVQAQNNAQGEQQNQAQPAPEQAPQPAPAGDNGLPIATVAPIPGGQPANGQDAEAIRTLVTGFNNETSMRRKMEYLPQHTCSRVIQENGGPEAFDFSAIPDVNLNDMPGGEQYDSSVTEVRDIMVDGDQASATVVATSNGAPSEATQRFTRENGAWTFCN
ncbi:MULTISPECIES: hypothetical protein [unclassified Corynebacterium]|uniref:hypothetical protein n=1 Tax=unclassified Corynebacterium TaxID=2624378 RepID=UPI0029CA46D5|nr:MULTISPECIES: hypothetical protein [unclassified Corynebacterium]WPF65397.1 hypothetical protein OLX12_07365 [Corynebacterium sp. 22KM0430]WPF67892.1 hypothetical protein OLW90_07355 [Corynebacterium sp. 21KM1197]